MGERLKRVFEMQYLHFSSIISNLVQTLNAVVDLCNIESQLCEFYSFSAIPFACFEKKLVKRD